MKIPTFLERQSKLFWVLTGIGLAFSLGIVDFLTGYEFAFSLFYLVPISLVGWNAGQRPALLTAAVSAVTWFLADIASGNIYTNPIIPLWNTIIRLGFFLIVVALLSTLKNAFQVQQDLARLDYNSGAVNARYFYELTQLEISRAQRYRFPLTLAYIDLDNFKFINDSLGHSVGDQVLLRVTQIVREQTRSSDIFARLGGDEFALLLPEINQTEVKIALSRVFSNLLAGMQDNGWPVTFSIGVATFLTPPPSVDEMVKTADQAMYSIKAGTKNGISFTLHSAGQEHPASDQSPTRPRKSLFG
jgi:diguanylate cyclase (GGDEF)-like protein